MLVLIHTRINSQIYSYIPILTFLYYTLCISNTYTLPYIHVQPQLYNFIYSCTHTHMRIHRIIHTHVYTLYTHHIGGVDEARKPSFWLLDVLYVC